jgi:hypothetical protein
VIRGDADKYVFDTLSRLHLELERIMNQVHNGIIMVEKDLFDGSTPPTSLKSASFSLSEDLQEDGEETADPVRPD